jgi:hypothetical protein
MAQAGGTLEDGAGEVELAEATVNDATYNGTPSSPPPGPSPAETPAKEWRCFHCDDVFTSKVDAENHFGRWDGADPACRIKAPGEFALLQALRNVEDQLTRYRVEDSDVMRARASMMSDHRQALRREEEKGYARGLADATKHPETLGLARISS